MIAQITTSYEKIRQDSAVYRLFGRVDLLLEFKDHRGLPPPFNIFEPVYTYIYNTHTHTRTHSHGVVFDGNLGTVARPALQSISGALAAQGVRRTDDDVAFIQIVYKNQVGIVGSRTRCPARRAA